MEFLAKSKEFVQFYAITFGPAFDRILLEKPVVRNELLLSITFLLLIGPFMRKEVVIVENVLR